MNIHFEPITPDNWRLFNKLKVKENQKGFVPENIGILARAFAFRECNSLVHAIYSYDEPIGLIMQYDYNNNEKLSCVLNEFMIADQYQSRGYGTEALRQWINMIKGEGKYDSIILCYIEGNEDACNLYLKAGFHHTGEIDENEVLMEYDLKKNV